MATAPTPSTFVKRTIPFSKLDEYNPVDRGRTESERSDFSDAYPVEISDIDPREEALKARDIEEKETLSYKARKPKTLKARVLDKKEAVGRYIASIISPGAKVVVKTSPRRGGSKKYTKKQPKRKAKKNYKKTAKRQPRT
jgi:hypothetical protein